MGRLLRSKEDPIRPHEGPVPPEEPRKRGADAKGWKARVWERSALPRSPAKTGFGLAFARAGHSSPEGDLNGERRTRLKRIYSPVVMDGTAEGAADYAMAAVS